MDNNLYVEKEQLARMIKEYYETGEFTSLLADTVLMMVKSILGARNFAGYSELWKEEMLSNGYYKATRAILDKNIDISGKDGGKSNAFGYLSATIHRAFVETLGAEKRRFGQWQEYRDSVEAIAKEKIQNRERGSAEQADMENDEQEGYLDD